MGKNLSLIIALSILVSGCTQLYRNGYRNGRYHVYTRCEYGRCW